MPETREIKMRVASRGIADAVYKEIEARRQLYIERDKVMHKLRSYRLMRHRVQVPKAYQRQLGGSNAIKMPITYRLVQTAVNAVAKGMPSIYIEPITPQDQRAADEVGHASNLLLQSIENQSHVPFLYSLYFNLFGDGLGVTKTQAGPWSGFPIKDDHEEDAVYLLRVAQYMAENPLPFTTRTVDPLTFYPPMDEYGRGVVVESGWRSRKEVLQSLRIHPTEKSDGNYSYSRIPDEKSWPDLEFPPGLPPTCRVDEVYSNDEVAVCMDGSRDVIIFENPTGEHPYTWGFAEPTGVHDPANVGMSIIYPLYYLAPWIDTVTAIMTAWAMFAAPTPYTTQDPDPRIRPTADHKIDIFQPGKMYHFPTGRKPGVLQPAPVGDSLIQYLNFLIDAADRGGLPALVSGSGVGSRLPALTFQAAFEAATDRLLPAVASAEKIIAGTLRKAFTIIADSGVPVRVNGADYEADPDGKLRAWAVLKPAELKKRRQITVKLPVDSTQDLIAKGTHAQFMVTAQLWDLAQGMRFSGVKDVQKTKDGIASDTAWRAALPALAQVILNSDPDFQAYQQQQQAAAGEAAATGATDANAPAPPEETPPEMAGGAMAAMAKGGYVGEPPDIGGKTPDYPGKPAGPGRNRGTVPAGRGGGRRGAPTHKPRGNRHSLFGKT